MLFLVLWLIGMSGVLSALWINLPASEEAVPFSPVAIKLLSLISPTFLLSIAVLIGVNLAPKVGLSAPFAEAIAQGTAQKFLLLKPQIMPGLIGGAIGGVVISAWSFLWWSSLPLDFLAKGEALSETTPLLTRILYGGITEEIMVRWGFMTLLVWGLWRMLQKGCEAPQPAYVILAIVVSALIFGLGHLPLAFALTAQATMPLILYVVIGNSFFGFIAGYLYWQKGLESAIVAHMLTHIVMIISDGLKR
ncbi:MAG: CPBP family intramembrane metalloprotease [Stenomitos rutilans HA7619-LM2]|nr:CPBP family intramembrane metalloprotease [Stenomitos rutilans HA7619-LM2]